MKFWIFFLKIKLTTFHAYCQLNTCDGVAFPLEVDVAYLPILYKQNMFFRDTTCFFWIDQKLVDMAVLTIK